MPDLWDAIIVGAGPAGSSLAWRLGSLGRSVLLLDSSRFPRYKYCGEYLGAGCLPLLDEMGALDDVLRLAHPGRTVTLCSPGGRVFRAKYPEGRFSLSLPRRELDAVLLERARQWKPVEVREGLRAERLLIEDGVVRGVIGGEQILRARVTVGADGRNSVVARDLGVFRWRRRRRVALGRHYAGLRPAGEGAEIFVGRSLYGILNHQKDGAANTSIVVREEGLNRWRGRLDAWFDSLLVELPRFRERLEGARAVEPVRALGPLAHYSTQVSADGALLAGDAAGFYDPFTGEGVFMALQSARLAAGVIHHGLEAGDLSRRFLRRYDIERAASLDSRYRLQAVIQTFVGRSCLADFAAEWYGARERAADRLLEIVGGLRRPGELI